MCWACLLAPGGEAGRGARAAALGGWRMGSRMSCRAAHRLRAWRAARAWQLVPGAWPCSLSSPPTAPTPGPSPGCMRHAWRARALVVFLGKRRQQAAQPGDLVLLPRGHRRRQLLPLLLGAPQAAEAGLRRRCRGGRRRAGALLLRCRARALAAWYRRHGRLPCRFGRRHGHAITAAMCWAVWRARSARSVGAGRCQVTMTGFGSGGCGALITSMFCGSCTRRLRLRALCAPPRRTGDAHTAAQRVADCKSLHTCIWILAIGQHTGCISAAPPPRGRSGRRQNSAPGPSAPAPR